MFKSSVNVILSCECNLQWKLYCFFSTFWRLYFVFPCGFDCGLNSCRFLGTFFLWQNQSRSIDLRKRSSLTVLFCCETGSFSCVWFAARFCSLHLKLWIVSFGVNLSRKVTNISGCVSLLKPSMMIYFELFISLWHTHKKVAHILVVDSRLDTPNKSNRNENSNTTQTKVDCFIWQVNMSMKQNEKK